MSGRKQVQMRLPEAINTPETKLYTNFKKRAKRHSDFLYRDEGKKPSLFRIHKKGSLFDSSFTVLIVRKSFTIIYDNNDDKNEIGFTVMFRTEDGKYKLLTVLKQDKAYFEKCKKPKKEQ